MNELNDSRLQTLASFDWQWSHVPVGDFMPGDGWFDAHASMLVADELCAIARSWFAGKRVLDAGCGQGRWTKPLLDLGAEVTAIDFSEAGLRRTRSLCGRTDRLQTSRVDLLALPAEFAQRRFDLVFSFGVLHHTGDTWAALEAIANLVDHGGALCLYLYGKASWSSEQSAHFERIRAELALLPFDEKLAALKHRFPEEDPHQLFDLLSPTLNDRVTFDEVKGRLHALGFSEVTPTIDSTEVFLRATREGFPRAALLPPIGERSVFLAETAARERRRRGARFEERLRVALRDVPRRTCPDTAVRALMRRRSPIEVLDLSLPPDRLPTPDIPGSVRGWDGPSVISPELHEIPMTDALVFLGAGIGACRHPREALSKLWSRVRPGGVLVVELAGDAFYSRRRTWLDKVLGYRSGVPEKLALLLSRRRDWCSGEGLYALGGRILSNPIEPDAALEALGHPRAEILPGRATTRILIASKPMS